MKWSPQNISYRLPPKLSQYFLLYSLSCTLHPPVLFYNWKIVPVNPLHLSHPSPLPPPLSLDKLFHPVFLKRPLLTSKAIHWNHSYHDYYQSNFRITMISEGISAISQIQKQKHILEIEKSKICTEKCHYIENNEWLAFCIVSNRNKHE